MGNGVHHYIPNSVPKVQKQMLEEIGAESIEDLFELIPEDLRFEGLLDIPEPLLDEYSLSRHMKRILSRNTSCEDALCFLGGGMCQHYVPAVCDEIVHRSEFLTAYAGTGYEDHGRHQALFEYASMVAELVDRDVVTIPTYDGSMAAATALRMAARITNRKRVLVPELIGRDRLSIIRNYCTPALEVQTVRFDRKTGQVDLEHLESSMEEDVAAVYFEVPNYAGVIEAHVNEISELAHRFGALSIVGVDPISLGVLAPPPHYGADIVTGELGSLGIHMFYGGGRGGFIATPDEERYVSEIPNRLFGIAPTVDGAWGFGDVAWERTSFAKREASKDFVGTMASLWGIAAGVYLALMGPKGMQEIGETIMSRSTYARSLLDEIPGIEAPVFDSPHFGEFMLRFDSGTTVAEVNEALLKRGIFGGVDLSGSFDGLGQVALMCVTEVHSAADIRTLASALGDVLREEG